jgi:hypothetical protein
VNSTWEDARYKVQDPPPGPSPVAGSWASDQKRATSDGFRMRRGQR